MNIRSLLLALLCLLLALPAAAAEDYFKRQLTWPASPRRILSLSPATTEMLYAVGAEKQVAGVTSDCNYPAAATKKPHLGRFGKFQLEQIVKLKPDLIVATADMGQALTPLRRLNIPLLAYQTPNVTAIQNNLLTLGRMTGHLPTAQKAVSGLQNRLKAVQNDKIAARSLLYLVDWPQMYVATTGSFIGNVLSLSGGRNVVNVGSAPFINYSLESLLKANPEVLIVPKSVASRLKLDQAPYNRLRAVQTKRVMTIDDDLISRPGPRVVTAIEQIHRYLRGLRP